jgi:rod shape-determining protein MreC
MNIEFLHRNRAGALLTLYVGFSLFCLASGVDAFVTGLKTSLWFLFSPEVVYSGGFFNKVDSVGGRFFRLIRAEGENFILRSQNAALAEKESERDYLEEENSRLRDLLQLRQSGFSDAVAADVVGRDVRNLFHSVVIDKGGEEGVEVSAAVVASRNGKPALVGRVTEILPHASKVLLLTDASSAVSGTAGLSGDLGLLEGKNRPAVVLSYLSPRSSVRAGDEVKTAGLGGVFPPGVPVGMVTRVFLGDEGFFRQAEVAPFADVWDLREVLVVKRRKSVDTRFPDVKFGEAKAAP